MSNTFKERLSNLKIGEEVKTLDYLGHHIRVTKIASELYEDKNSPIPRLLTASDLYVLRPYALYRPNVEMAKLFKLNDYAVVLVEKRIYIARKTQRNNLQCYEVVGGGVWDSYSSIVNAIKDLKDYESMYIINENYDVVKWLFKYKEDYITFLKLNMDKTRFVSPNVDKSYWE